MTLTMYLLCKHKKLEILVVRLAMQQIKEVGAVTQESSIVGLLMAAILHYKKSKLCRGHVF